MDLTTQSDARNLIAEKKRGFKELRLKPVETYNILTGVVETRSSSVMMDDEDS